MSIAIQKPAAWTQSHYRAYRRRTLGQSTFGRDDVRTCDSLGDASHLSI